MFIRGKHITARAFGIEKVDVSVFHADNEVDIKESLFATLPLVVFNGIVGFATVAVLIPPVNVLRIGFKEFDKFLFGI